MPNTSSSHPARESALHPATVLAAAAAGLRPHQWLKNTLVFVPLAAAHLLADRLLLANAALAFVAFSLCASAVYLLNDLHDVAADRAHPHKRFRPIPSGRLPVPVAIGMIPLLLAGAGVAAAVVGHDVFAVLIGYLVLNLAYTFRFKSVILLDAFILAAGYALRVFAGALAVSIVPSARLLAFCIFLFFSLALIKRYAELTLVRSRDGPSAHARAYRLEDLDFILVLGVSCGVMSVLVLALYLGTSVAEHFYSRSQLMWVTCILLLYWISHLWLMAHRGRMSDDPLVFAVKDPVSLGLGVLMGITAWLAI